MKHILAAALLALALPAAAQETRTLTDDTGADVAIPLKPQRIVALHDLILTIPLIELGAPPVGSHGRGETPADAFIRSSAQVTATDFDNSDMEWMGNNPADIERIAAMAPHLILTTEWQGVDAAHLRTIAPTFVVDDAQRTDWEIYDLLADMTGTNDRLTALKRRYDAQINLIRSVIDTEAITVSTVQPLNGGLFTYAPYGHIGKVLTDAGFRQPEIIEAMAPGEEREVSGETIQAFDADFLFTTYRSSAGQTPSDLAAELEAVMPGYCDLLHACRTGQMIMLSRAENSASSYDALGMVAYAILTSIGGQPFEPMPD